MESDLRESRLSSLGAARTSAHAGGLRRQWRIAFVVLLSVISLAISGTVIAFLQVGAHYRDAAIRLNQAIALTNKLTGEITDHESQAHSLWNGSAVDQAGYLRQQRQIVTLFDQALVELTGRGEHTLVAHASRTWRSVLISRGLWGPSAAPRPGVTLEMQQQFGSDSDEIIVTLSRLTSVAISDGSRDLRLADAFQRIAFALLAAMLAMVVGLMIYQARRWTSDLLRPLEDLHNATETLRAGSLDRRVEIREHGGSSEVVALAAAFNEMADALDESHRELILLASHDTLTGLPNRAEFQLQLSRQMGPGRVDPSHRDLISVLFIDVDDFKVVNDNLGHAAGDALLAAVAARLADCVRGEDVVARLGGDEFAILLSDPLHVASTHTMADRVIEAIAAPFSVAGTEVFVTVSIGVRIGDPATDDPATLLAQADYAMYTSKRDGKGRQTLFEAPALTATAADNGTATPSG